MKKMIFALISLVSLLTFAEVGENATIRAAIEAEFNTVTALGSITYQDRAQGQGCDVLANVLVEGNLGSGHTLYECDLCLLDAGNGFFDFDRDTIFCSRVD